MEKRNNKKLFAIIGGSVLAFVLTIALSVSITLAYFGSTDDGQTTVNLGQAVNVNSTQETTQTLNNVLPGQILKDVSANAVVQQSSTKAFLLAIVETSVTNTAADATVLTNLVATESTWASVGTTSTGTVYVYGTADKLSEVDATAANATVNFLKSIQIPAMDVDNDYAEAVLTIKVRFVAVQSSIAVGTDNATKDTDGDGFVNGNVAYTDAEAAFKDIFSYTIV